MEERPSQNNLLHIYKNKQNIENGGLFTNVFNIKKNVGHTETKQSLLVDIKHSPKNESETKRNVCSSTTSFYTTEGNTAYNNHNEFLEEIRLFKNYFLASKNIIKRVSRKNTMATNTQQQLISRHIPNKPKLQQRNIFTQIDPGAKPSNNKMNNIPKEVLREEKMTYCRPVVNKFTQQFFHQAMEKNARLQNLVKRLVQARQKEKENESWNNYINELKNKHASYDPCSSNVETLMPRNDTMTIIEDYNNVRHNQYSYPYDNIYDDNIRFSDSDVYQNDWSRRYYIPTANTVYKYQNNPYCFPTSSQARIIMQNRERYENRCAHQWQNRSIGSHIILDRDREEKNKKKLNKCTCNDGSSLKSTVAQTEAINFNNNNNNLIKDNNDKYDLETVDDIKSKYIKVANDVDKIKEKIKESRYSSKQQSLAKIECKLDCLIQSINTFIMEVKTKKTYDTTLHKSVAVSNSVDKNQDMDETNNLNKNANIDISNNFTFGLPTKGEIICGMSTNSPKYSGSNNKPNDTINDILLEEMNKSDKVKKDIEEILTKNDRQCAVQITFDVPTKEHCTEVTDSFYDTHDAIVEDIDIAQSMKRGTIAVNTDPLGFYALLRMSTDAVKQMLSYVPNIDYLSYLACNLVQPLPRIKSESEVCTTSRLVCNICGATFSQPSRLSDHIQQHNLADTRNCCVCRHVIDMKRHRSGLFQCQYCGQVFTRAYCRQLHEQACRNKTVQAGHEVTPASLVLLS